MARYLLACSCGASIEVEPRQAGERVRCSCGAELEAPPLRRMRELPLADEADTRHRGGWGFRHGLLTAGLLACVVFSAVGALCWAREPAPPADFDPAQRDQIVAADVQKWTFAQSWGMWVAQYRPTLIRGRLQVVENPYNQAIQQQIELYRVVRWASFGFAAVAGIGGLAAFFAVGPQGGARDQAPG